MTQQWRDKYIELREALSPVVRNVERDLHGGYIALDGAESCLDGDFSAHELRQIADAMDKIAATPEFKAFEEHERLRPE